MFAKMFLNMSLSSVLKKLEHDSLLAIEWFEANCMKLNAEAENQESNNI